MAHEEEQFEVPKNVPAFNIEYPWLNFQALKISGISKAKKLDYKKRLERMLRYPVFAQQAIDWDFLKTVAPHDPRFESGAAELESMLEASCGDFVPQAWDRLFRIQGPIYIKAT